MLALARLFAPFAGQPRRPRLGLFARLALRRSRARLGHLDDHLLRDIGLTPEQAQREADRSFWDAPAHWHD